LSQDLLKLRCPGPRCDRGRVSEKRRGRRGRRCGHPWARYRDHQPIGGQSATGASTFNNRYGVAHKRRRLRLCTARGRPSGNPRVSSHQGGRHARRRSLASNLYRAARLSNNARAGQSRPRRLRQAGRAPQDVKQEHGRHGMFSEGRHRYLSSRAGPIAPSCR